MDASALYKAEILALARSSRFQGAIAHATHRQRRVNALCGDRVDVDLRVEGDRVVEARFVARGCAICSAAAAIACERAEGQPLGVVRAWAERLRALLEPGAEEGDAELAPLLGVRHFPGRVGCATLPFEALAAALDAGPIEASSAPPSAGGSSREADR